MLTDAEFDQAKKLNAKTSTIQEPEPRQQKKTAPAKPTVKNAKKETASKIIESAFSYGTATFVGTLISICGWIMVAGGIVGVLAVLKGDFFSGILAAIFGIVSILGLMTVASGQLISATVDIANNSAALLALEKAKWDKENGLFVVFIRQTSGFVSRVLGHWHRETTAYPEY